QAARELAVDSVRPWMTAGTLELMRVSTSFIPLESHGSHSFAMVELVFEGNTFDDKNFPQSQVFLSICVKTVLMLLDEKFLLVVYQVVEDSTLVLRQGSPSITVTAGLATISVQ
ncbi:hypothetical protein LTR41_012233, partial [Exophiala xenobiotica]